MTLPANDAFTLGLPHDSSRLGLHTPSTKLPFVSGAKTSHTSPTAPRTAAERKRQSMSPGRVNGVPAGKAQLKKRASKPDAPPQSDKKGKGSAVGVRAPAKRTLMQRVVEEWEIPRKVLHSSIGFLTLYLYTSHGNPRNVVIVLSASLVVIVPCDLLRLRSSVFERQFESCVCFLMRESEKKSTNGVIWYMLGVIFALTVYPIDVAVVSILILSWADTAASTIGRLYGRYTPPLPHRLPLLNLPLAARKSLAGFLAASVTGAAIAASFWGWLAPVYGNTSSWHWSSASPVDGPVRATGGWLGLGVLSLASGLVSGIAEALDLGSLDDNLTLPIISGGCLWGFFKLLEALGA